MREGFKLLSSFRRNGISAAQLKAEQLSSFRRNGISAAQLKAEQLSSFRRNGISAAQLKAEQLRQKNTRYSTKYHWPRRHSP